MRNLKFFESKLDLKFLKGKLIPIIVNSPTHHEIKIEKYIPNKKRLVKG